jgi:3-phenylpropionate/cinnamic acid dioxygenase small subunit
MTKLLDSHFGNTLDFSSVVQLLKENDDKWKARMEFLLFKIFTDDIESVQSWCLNDDFDEWVDSMIERIDFHLSENKQ